MPNIGPIVLAVVGDKLLQSCRIIAIEWVSDDSAIGDRVVLDCPETNSLLWKSVATWNHTENGRSFGPDGIHAPHGFIVSVISSGELLVYIKEN